MKTSLVVQPPDSLGSIITTVSLKLKQPRRLALVSAWAHHQTLLRMRGSVARFRDAGADVSVVVGIDLGGTSLEALTEIAGWGVNAWILKNRRRGHTFHPKIYLIEGALGATLLLGSSNLTEGGFYTNYEADVRMDFVLPDDVDEYSSLVSALEPVLSPSTPTAASLTPELIAELERRGFVKREIEVRGRFERVAKGSGVGIADLFGADEFAAPPPLPVEVMDELAQDVKVSRRRASSKGAKRRVSPPRELLPNSFYMTLNPLQGSNIPGEARVPMEARDMAESFWGWPQNYRRESRARGRKTRGYWNWKPSWSVAEQGKPSTRISQRVRMYEYVDSADFRFYSPQLVALGADKGDVVRITRLSKDDENEFECLLAKRGSTAHGSWLKFCTRGVRNSTRVFGYS